MKELTYNGKVLCKLQAQLFYNFAQYCTCSPYIFIRRFLCSKVAQRFDNTEILIENISLAGIVRELEEQYGETKFGNPNRVDKEVLYWVGYIYRYWSFTRDIPSRVLVQKVQPDVLISRYPIYHTMDLDYAIDRIIEEEKITFLDLRANKDILQLIEEYMEHFTK